MRLKLRAFGRAFNAWLAAVLLVFIGLGWCMIRDSSATFDEAVHLASGYTCLVKESPRCLVYLGHPPFGEKWAALPLLAWRPRTFFDHPDWIDGRHYNYADLFLYGNDVPAETMLNAARLWSLATWSAALAIGILEWSLRLGGRAGLLAGGILFAFCPALISNAAVVGTDACSSAFFFATFWLLSMRPRLRRHWILAGTAAGLGLASKFNMVVIPAFVGAGLLIEAVLAREETSPRARVSSAGLGGSEGQACGGLGGVLLSGVCALAALGVPYRFYGLPDYLRGLRSTFGLVEEGRASFLFGSISATGHALYFPAALAIKTPIPLLAAAALGFFSMLRSGGRKKEALWLSMPPAAYFAAAGFAKSQIGYRHILPVYPFLVVLGAVGAAWAWRRSGAWRIAAASMGVWLVVGVLGVHPDYLAYFNEIVGGAPQGYRCLVDSNLDWGQGLKELAAELKRRGNPPVVLSYFGNGDPSYYGIRYVPLAFLSLADRLRSAAGAPELERPLLAVSATNLQGVYFRDPRYFDWLRSRAPAFVAGHSIFLYDLTGDPEGIRRLSSLLALDGRPEAARRLSRGEM